MANIAVLSLAFLALVAFAEVSAHRTIITTTTIDEEDINQSSQQRCRQQIQQRSFNGCQRYLSRQGSPYGETIVMPINQGSQQLQELQQCCQELQNIDDECQCEAIQQVFRQEAQRQQQQGQGGRQGQQQQEVRQLQQRAQSIPRQCGLRTQQCQVQAVWF